MFVEPHLQWNFQTKIQKDEVPFRRGVLAEKCSQILILWLIEKTLL